VRLGKVVAVALLLLIVGAGVWAFASFKAYNVPQKGMDPSIEAGTTVIGRLRPYTAPADVERGDVVVYRQEHDGKTYDFIWRVIGLPGEEIEIVDDVVIIDGKRAQRSRLRAEQSLAIYSEQLGGKSYTIALPEPAMDKQAANMKKSKLAGDEFFLLGDNRHNAVDSRAKGPVAFSRIVARVVWP
jgi:signal peptidase I